MSEPELKGKEKPEELIKAEKLINEGKHEEALQIMKSFAESGERPLHEIMLCQLLKCELLLQQGLYKDVIKLADQTYNKSLGLGKNLLSVDALNLMAEGLIRFNNFDEAFDKIKQGEELLNTQKQEHPTGFKQREAYIAYLKAYLYNQKGEADRSLEHNNHAIALLEDLDTKHKIHVFLLVQKAFMLCTFKGEIDLALANAGKSMDLAKEINSVFAIAYCHNTLGTIYSYTGDLESTIVHYKQSLEIFTSLNNKERMAGVLNNLGYIYRRNGELDLALEYLEENKALRYELGNLRDMAWGYDYLIQTLIEKGDLERAQQNLDQFEQINNQLKDKFFNIYYLFSKALILKNDCRIRNWAKAEKLFKKIIEENFSFETTINSLIHLCDLLYMELGLTNEIKVVDDLNQFIAQLLDLSEKSQSNWLLCETYQLLAKISLLTFDIKKAQRLLTQAQQVAERVGLNELVTKISKENDNLRKKLGLWERLKDEGAPIAERLKLARLDEQIGGILQNRAVLTAQVTEEKVTIHKEKKICLVCRGEVLRFSYICECGVIYCENCARALTNLENVCWACDVPIDYLKPIKPYKEEEERVQVEEKGKMK